MKTLVAMIIFAYTTNVFADGYHTFCTNAICNFMQNNSYRPGFTNSVVSYIGGESGTNRASARVVLAVALFDIYEASSDESSLNSCMVCCSNVINSTDCPDVSWQKSAASAVLATAFATKGRYGEAFTVCTNALNRHVTSPMSNDDMALWGEMCSHQFLQGLSIRDTLNFYSAMSLLFGGDLSLYAQYTNSLPNLAIEKINEARE